jgi:hypothetical protein
MQRFQGPKPREASRPPDDIFFQPWYLPKDVYLQIRRILPNIHLSKMRFYFEDHGCLKCGAHQSLYGSNGLCEKCSNLIRGRIVRALQRRLQKVGVLEPNSAVVAALSDGMTRAQELLRKLKPGRSQSR